MKADIQKSRAAALLLALCLIAVFSLSALFVVSHADHAMRFIPACPPCGISQRGWGPLPIMDWARCSCCSALCCLFPCRTGVPVP